MITPRNKKTEYFRTIKTKEFRRSLCHVLVKIPNVICWKTEQERDLTSVYGVDEASIGILDTILVSSIISLLKN